MNSTTFAPLKLSTLKTRQDGSQYRLIHPIAATREWERHVSTPNNRSDVFRVPKRFRKGV